MARVDNRIIFVGHKEGDKLYAWYNIAQCFVLASYQEPFGAVTNEAMLGGCWPFISIQAGSQCLIEDKVNGNVFSPTNKEQLRDLIKNKLLPSTPIKLPLQLRKNLMLQNFNVLFSEFLKSIQ